MEPQIKLTSTKLIGVNGFELFDRTDGHVIAEWYNTFDLAIIANVYQARLGRMTEIRQKTNTRDTIE